MTEIDEGAGLRKVQANAARERYEQNAWQREMREWAFENDHDPANDSLFEDHARILRRMELSGNKALAAKVAQGPSASASKEIRSFIAGNHLLSSYYIMKAEQARKSVAHIDAPGGPGSGFLIGPGVIMTNQHILPSLDWARRTTVTFDYIYTPDEVPKEGKIRPTTFMLDPDALFFRDEDLDYAIVALEIPYTEDSIESLLMMLRGYNKLHRRSGTALYGERVTIIQHPHGRAQKIALRDNRIVDIVEDFLHYEAEAHPGSSGSPIWSDEWNLVGLHHQGDINPEQRRPGHKPANEGVRVSSIVAHLDRAMVADKQKDERNRYWTPDRRKQIADCFKPVHLHEIEMANEHIGMIKAFSNAATSGSTPAPSPPNKINNKDDQAGGEPQSEFHAAIETMNRLRAWAEKNQ